jgi:hypothetical protein
VIARHVAGDRRRPAASNNTDSQAGRAVCAAWTKDAEWRPRSHGLRRRESEAATPAERVFEYAAEVTSNRRGIYSMVIDATASSTFEGFATVAELWASLPGWPTPIGSQGTAVETRPTQQRAGAPSGAPGLLRCQEAGVSPCAPGRRPERVSPIHAPRCALRIESHSVCETIAAAAVASREVVARREDARVLGRVSLVSAASRRSRRGRRCRERRRRACRSV